MTIREQLIEILEAHANGVPFNVQFSEEAGHGDYATNIALVRGKKEGTSSQELASAIVKEIEKADIVERTEIAGPGFINITVATNTLITQLTQEKRNASGKQISIEFVSANPTGPLHIGNSRGGPIGDTIARALEHEGHTVTREYLNNDRGAQVIHFRDALWYWYLGACGHTSALEEVQYSGEYVKALAEEAKNLWRDKLIAEGEQGKDSLLSFAFERLHDENFATLSAMGVSYDKITNDSDLLEGATQETIAELDAKGLIIEKDGARWFAPKSAYMEEPAVVEKGDGTLIYFANDIAYHKQKFAENDVVIDVLGEGHHGHIPKLQAVAETFEFPLEDFHVLVHGQVNLIKDGKPHTMSKRAGNFVTAREVLDLVGVDAFRYFLLSYDPKSGMQFDIDLAREQSKNNPVYYIQYAHARAARLLEQGGGVADVLHPELFNDAHARNLLRRMSQFHEVVSDVARDFAVQRLARYAYELARDFTSFYENVRVLDDADKKEERLALVERAKTQLANVLSLLGISAPEEM